MPLELWLKYASFITASTTPGPAYDKERLSTGKLSILLARMVTND